MTIKQKLITGYVIVAFIFAFYSRSFGPFQNYNFSYNLGRGLVWPFTIFSGMGVILSLIVIAAYAAFVFMGDNNTTSEEQ